MNAAPSAAKAFVLLPARPVVEGAGERSEMAFQRSHAGSY